MTNRFQEMFHRKFGRHEDEETGLGKSGEDPEGFSIFKDMANLLLQRKKEKKSSKHNTSASASASTESSGNEILTRISPMGNTLLHIAAVSGKVDEWVKEVTENKPILLAQKNENEDTALHVAARAGHISTLQELLAALLRNLPYSEKPKEVLDEILVKNRRGNTFFHEAMLNSNCKEKDVMKILNFKELQTEAPGFKELVERAALFWTNKEDKSVLHLAIEKDYRDIVDDALTILTTQPPELDQLIQNHQELAKMNPKGSEVKKQQKDSSKMDTWEESESPFNIHQFDHYMASHDMVIVTDNFEKISQGNNTLNEKSSQDSSKDHQEPAQLIPYDSHYVPPGKSPLIVAILQQKLDILRKILKKKKEWIHLRDDKGRTAIHYAASVGYLEGVKLLLESDISCHWKRDYNHGFFPLHLASAGGHVEVVKKLLEHCPRPRKLRDFHGRNIAHIAAQMGKFNVVKYIWQDAKHGLVAMINDKDVDRNTPLHLATLHCHPKVVHALTWDERVYLHSVNKDKHTALDVCMQFPKENAPNQQGLVRMALQLAGAQRAKKGSHFIEGPDFSKAPDVTQSVSQQNSRSSMDLYNDKINTLMLVSTLITTVTFTAGFTLPGGTDSNSSSPGQGMALMLNHPWFRPFIFCLSISLYGSIGATIILIWAKFEDVTLARLAIKVAIPLLAITFTTLSVAFMAGVHLVISDLSWLATTFLVVCVLSILLLWLLYGIFKLPSLSTRTVIRQHPLLNLVIRYISYHYLLFLIKMVG